MEQVYRSDEPSREQVAAVAERLQQLSTGEVERILRRAIELQSEKDTRIDRTGLDRAALRRVADEIGIDPDHLEAALTEELLRIQADDPTLIDRLLAPTSVVTRDAVAGDAAAVRTSLDRWLGYHAGLRKRAATPGSALWEADRSLVTSARVKLRAAQGGATLRSTAGVRDSVQPVEDRRSIVTLEADTSNVRRLAVGLLAGSAGLALAAGVTTGVAFGLPEGLAAGTVSFGLLGGGVLLGVRMWIDNVRRALARAIDAAGHPELVDDVDPVSRSVGRILDYWRSARDESRRRR